MHHVHPGAQPEQLRLQVGQRARPLRGEVVLPRRRLEVLHQFRHGLHGQRGRHHEDVRHIADAGDRHEILGEVGRLVAVGDGGDGGVADGGHVERVAVRRGLGGVAHAQRPPGARAVFHHHRLLEHLGEPRTHGAGQHVGGAGGRERQHELDRAIRILGQRGGRGQGAREAGGGNQQRQGAAQDGARMRRSGAGGQER
ncbi:hypothetical protein D3C81_1169690 [compost metagenome]